MSFSVSAGCKDKMSTNSCLGGSCEGRLCLRGGS